MWTHGLYVHLKLPHLYSFDLIPLPKAFGLQSALCVISPSGHLENDADEGEDRIAKKARVKQIEPMVCSAIRSIFIKP